MSFGDLCEQFVSFVNKSLKSTTGSLIQTTGKKTTACVPLSLAIVCNAPGEKSFVRMHIET